MPYPMIENNCLNSEIRTRLKPSVLDFYLENKKRMKIGIIDNEILFTIFGYDFFSEIYEKTTGIKNPEGNPIGGYIFREKDIEKYLD